MSTFWTFLFLCVICSAVCRIATAKIKTREEHRYGDDDVRTIQEIHRGMQRFEDRIDALETILMDRSRARGAYSEFE